MYVYRPDKYTISIGIPAFIIEALNLENVIEPTVQIRDWVSVTSDKPVTRFSYRTGVFGEPFVEMNRNTSRIFSLSILQTSEDIRILRELFRLQTFGETGFPFSLFDDAIEGDFLKQKSAYSTAVILDEPQESWGLEGVAWVYRIQTIYGTTAYL